MKVIYGIKHIRRFNKPVVAMGVFDGVHLGHRKILRSAVIEAHRIKGTSVALTFWPHPRDKEALYSLEHRLRLISELGIDVCIVVNFNRSFAKLEADSFAKNILFRRIGASHIYVGKNFRFGRNAEGDSKTLKRLSRVFTYKLKLFKVIKIKGKPISSTYIRELIRGGDLITAQKLLTRPVSVLGTVIKGMSIGRTLGFPTANINPHHEVIPPIGVYAVKVILGNKKLEGICNIGLRPTFRVQTEANTHIELHVFNFKRNIYSEYVEIQFMKKIRDEQKFPSPSALVKQIKKDILKAKKILKSRSSLSFPTF